MDSASQASAYHKTGVVTGLAAEVAVAETLLTAAPLETTVVCAGASTARATALAEELIAGGSEALLSFGIAGALAPDLESGDLIVAHGLRDASGEDLATDLAWRGALTAALDENFVHYREGAILGSSRMLRKAADKAAAFAECGCLAVDMESAAVGAAAAKAGLPFLAVRAIADRAGDTLPALVESAVRPDGHADIGRAITALLKRPTDLPATLRLARRTELGLARLRMLDGVKEVLFGRF